MTIQALLKRGVYLCDIAEQLGVHRKPGGEAWGTAGLPPGPVWQSVNPNPKITQAARR